MPCFFLRLAALLTEDCQPGLPHESESLALGRLCGLFVRTSRFEGARLQAVPFQSSLAQLPKQMNNPNKARLYQGSKG